VQSNGITYRYVISTGKKGIIESDSVINELQKTAVYVEKNRLPQAEPIHLKAQAQMNVVSARHNSIPSLVQNKTPENIVIRYENSFVEKKQPARKKVTEYVIHTGEIGFVMKQPETEVLRKIRL